MQNIGAQGFTNTMNNLVAYNVMCNSKEHFIWSLRFSGSITLLLLCADLTPAFLGGLSHPCSLYRSTNHSPIYLLIQVNEPLYIWEAALYSLRVQSLLEDRYKFLQQSLKHVTVIGKNGFETLLRLHFLIVNVHVWGCKLGCEPCPEGEGI